MNKWCVLMAAVAIGLSLMSPTELHAQNAAVERARAQAAERERIEAEVLKDEARLDALQLEREVDPSALEIEREMRDAESLMAEAARRIAELSMRRFPAGAAWQSGHAGRPLLGVTLAKPKSLEPVAGVKVTGVSPGGAAAEMGLRAGDVITALNGESLKAPNSKEAHRRVTDFMDGVEAGDQVDVAYLRSGKTQSVTLEPRPVGMEMFSYRGPDSTLTPPGAPTAPNAPLPPRAAYNQFVFMSDGQGFGDMEMVRMTDTLGRYFGTAEGLLVVRAPKDKRYQLVDGDVILDVDGRKPKSVSHAIRILGSYQAGENLKLRVMRDKREEQLTIEMPDLSPEGSVSRADN